MSRKKITPIDISKVCHDLKSPLTTIKIFTELAISRTDNTKSGQVASYLQKIDKNINKLTNRINNLSLYSKIISGQFPLSLVEIKSDVLCGFICRGLKSIYPTVIDMTDPGQPALLKADSQLLSTVFVQLADTLSQTENSLVIKSWVNDKYLVIGLSQDNTSLAPYINQAIDTKKLGNPAVKIKNATIDMMLSLLIINIMKGKVYFIDKKSFPRISGWLVLLPVK